MNLHEIQVAANRVLVATPVFDTYWHFAVKRQNVFMRRVSGLRPPWSDDPVLIAHRFTNAYRAADRVSQYLIRNVIYAGPQNEEDVYFRTILFKIFNRIQTWEALSIRLGPIIWKTFDIDRYAQALGELLSGGEQVYSGAYIMPSPSFGHQRKHQNHLRLIDYMMKDGAPRRVAQAQSLQEIYAILRGYPSLGDFLAYQFTIDLNYSELVNFSEMDFVIAGPGARDGIRKCFVETAGMNNSDVIRVVAERADEECHRLGIKFLNLWGRPLQLIDCQNLFCEVDKYARVVHPSIRGESGRTRIKQKFRQNSDPISQWYPPKWNLRPPERIGGDVLRASASSSPLDGTCNEPSRGREIAQLPLL